MKLEEIIPLLQGTVIGESAYDGKRLFSTLKSKSCEKYLQCEVRSIWSGISVTPRQAYALPIIKLYISDYDLRR